MRVLHLHHLLLGVRGGAGAAFPGSGQGEGSDGVADSLFSETAIAVPGLQKVLPLLHPRLQQGGSTHYTRLYSTGFLLDSRGQSHFQQAEEPVLVVAHPRAP